MLEEQFHGYRSHTTVRIEAEHESIMRERAEEDKEEARVKQSPVISGQGKVLIPGDPQIVDAARREAAEARRLQEKMGGDIFLSDLVL